MKKNNNYNKKLFSIIKSIFDKIFASLSLILLLPLIIVISIIIKMSSKGPIIFKQLRTGQYGKNIYIYKFRTMSNNKITKIGTLLRKTSIDEIPQLLSIIKGNMSLIGPRPWIPEYYKNMNEKQKHRYDVKPGLTGLAQVMGRNNITILEKIDYDLEYIKHYSLLQDIKIFFLSIKTVLSTKGYEADNKIIKKEIDLLKKLNSKEKKSR